MLGNTGYMHKDGEMTDVDTGGTPENSEIGLDEVTVNPW